MRSNLCPVAPMQMAKSAKKSKPMKIRILLAVFLLGVSSLAFAEGGCPAGMIPYSGTDLSSCGPVPAGYYGNKNDNALKPYKSPVRWAKTWGAIASDNTLGKVGAATGKMSEQEAEAAATESCYARGGGAGCTNILLTYWNQCGAMAWGESYSTTARAGTVEEASKIAIQSCSKHTADCQIYYADCSPAKRIQ